MEKELRQRGQAGKEADSPKQVHPGGHRAAAPEPLEAVLERVAGPERSIIMTSVAVNYVEVARLWARSVARLGYGGRILFVANDADAYAALRRDWPQQTVFPEGNGQLAGSPAEGRYLSPFFNAVVWRKPAHMRMVLERNITVLYTDCDTLWLQDPFPFLRGEAFDALMPLDLDDKMLDTALDDARAERPAAQGTQAQIARGGEKLCTCFILLRPTPGGRELLHMWEGSRNPNSKMEDQHGLNYALRKMLQRGVQVGVLPFLRFPSGCMFFDEFVPGPCHTARAKYQDVQQEFNATSVVVHANYMAGVDKKWAALSKFAKSLEKADAKSPPQKMSMAE